MASSWIDGSVSTAAFDVPRARTRLSARDHLGSILKARLAVARMDYRVPPGLYAVGQPTSESPVLVSANYKLSFDRLRGAMSGRAAWILVLDTDGINVWCAAGKGTFGTDEIVQRVGSSRLAQVVSHRTLVVPQLGAPGVSAHEVRRRCGFRVVYGPVEAKDLSAFLEARMKATPSMRQVQFKLRDRVVLIPVELTLGAGYMLLVAAAFLLLGGFSPQGYSVENVRASGLPSALMFLGTFLGATVLGPVLLPWLPGRAFSVKGLFLGFWLAAAMLLLVGLPWLHALAWALLIPALSSFLVMNFTGASTYTSLSGVQLEIRFAVPAQIAAALIGFALWLTGLFVAQGQS